MMKRHSIARVVKKSPTGGTPSWMKEIIAPVKGMSADDEETFYSSGC